MNQENSVKRIEKMREMDEAFRQLRRLIHAEWNRFNVKGLGMTDAKMVLLLSEHGPQKASVMAELLQITSGAVTGIADRLINFGYIDRERSEEDRRIVLLTITDEGRQLVDGIMRVREDLMLRLYEGFSLEDMDITVSMFTRMSENLERKREDSSDA